MKFQPSYGQADLFERDFQEIARSGVRNNPDDSYEWFYYWTSNDKDPHRAWPYNHEIEGADGSIYHPGTIGYRDRVTSARNSYVRHYYLPVFGWYSGRKELGQAFEVMVDKARVQETVAPQVWTGTELLDTGVGPGEETPKEEDSADPFDGAPPGAEKVEDKKDDKKDDKKKLIEQPWFLPTVTAGGLLIAGSLAYWYVKSAKAKG